MSRVLVTVLALLVLAMPATAQTGRVMGLVIDQTGKAIKGATIRASNPEAAQSLITSTTDDKGRFGMIGLRAGVWQFLVEAPGFEPMSGTVPIRSATLGPPMRIVLRQTPEVIPGALTRDVTEQVASATALRAQGRTEQALAAYEAIHAKNSKLTQLNTVIGDVLLQQAERETSPVVRQAFYDRAVAAYAEAAKDVLAGERVRLDLGLTQILAGRVDEGTRTLQDLVASTPDSSAGRDAAAKLVELRR